MNVNRIIAGLFFLFSIFSCSNTQLTIDENWKIVLGKKATKIEETAAKDLQEFLITKHSIKLKIIKENSKSYKNSIVIGTEFSNAIIKDMIHKNQLKTNKQNEEGFHLKTSSNNVYIAGNDEIGVLYGTVFFEDMIEKHTISDISNIDTIRHPFFTHRCGAYMFNWTAAQNKPDWYSNKEFGKWLAHHYINFNGRHNGTANLTDDIAEDYGIGLYAGGSSNFFAKKRTDLTEWPIMKWKKKYPDYVVKSQPNIYHRSSIPVVCLHTEFGYKMHKDHITNIRQPILPLDKCGVTIIFS